MTHAALDAIETFFHSGRGLYIWGDNDPYFTDANLVLQRLFKVAMSGNSPGDKVVSMLTTGRRQAWFLGTLSPPAW